MNRATVGIRYAHTNLIARDWQKLAAFYEQVLACEPVSTVRDHHGPHTDALTGMNGVRVRGRHLRLPGHGENGPTIEIFEYEPAGAAQGQRLDRAGFAHIAFEIPDIASKRLEIHAWGGRDIGQLVTFDIPGAGRLQVIYVTDPEGNILELQNWQR